MRISARFSTGGSELYLENLWKSLPEGEHVPKPIDEHTSGRVGSNPGRCKLFPQREAESASHGVVTKAGSPPYDPEAPILLERLHATTTKKHQKC